jgi:hypothetical protein
VRFRVDENGNGELKVTSQLQTFSLIVTSEPYQSVRSRASLSCWKNALRKDTKGKSFTVDQYRLMKRTQYEKVGNPLSLTVDTKNVPLEMLSGEERSGHCEIEGSR